MIALIYAVLGVLLTACASLPLPEPPPPMTEYVLDGELGILKGPGYQSDIQVWDCKNPVTAKEHEKVCLAYLETDIKALKKYVERLRIDYDACRKSAR